MRWDHNDLSDSRTQTQVNRMKEGGGVSTTAERDELGFSEAGLLRRMAVAAAGTLMSRNQAMHDHVTEFFRSRSSWCNHVCYFL